MDALRAERKDALRIGLTGTPGVGKSTFIESFGMMLVGLGLRVAVLAVDPSSARSGGSILGDKTRMDRLARAPEAFIRPSPSQSTLGGVARRTRDAIFLCEAAAYDVILIETVGVGQSETLVSKLCDIFVLLLAPAGGDELQGVKRGIMELADLVVINKADGELAAQAMRTAADYRGALRLMRKRPQDPADYPKTLTISALEEDGLTEVWSATQTLANWRREHGILAQNRAEQARHWLKAELESGLMDALNSDKIAMSLMQSLENDVAAGKIQPEAAAAEVLNAFNSPRT